MATNKNNSGALFRNDKKKTKKHPDYTGSCVIDGVDYRVSGWVKDGKQGKSQYLSLAFTVKDNQAGDDLPF